jgi:hypothetical protein
MLGLSRLFLVVRFWNRRSSRAWARVDLDSPLIPRAEGSEDIVEASNPALTSKSYRVFVLRHAQRPGSAILAASR